MLSYNDVWALVNRWHIEMRVTHLGNLALLVYGIIQSQSGCLSAIAHHWPHGPRQQIHRLGRLHRFLENFVEQVPSLRHQGQGPFLDLSRPQSVHK
jgi:hypothetical protein